MVTKQEKFIHEFADVYNQATKTEYGSAQLASVERQGLRKLIVRARQELNSNDRNKIREKVVEYLVADGWPIEVLANAPDLAQTAIYHACVVAEFLIGDRWIDMSPDTIWSYATKNQFDRWVANQLLKTGRIAPGGNLFDQWFNSHSRQIDYKNDKVGYPTQVDSTEIYGVGKAHRYWPAQLMRNLEAIRLGKMSQSQLGAWKIEGIEIGIFTIPWVMLERDVAKAVSVNDIAIKILFRVMEILQTRGLNPEQIIEIVINSYSPRGMLAEHGNIPQVAEIWTQILYEVQSHTTLSPFYEELSMRVKTRFQEAGFELYL